MIDPVSAALSFGGGILGQVIGGQQHAAAQSQQWRLARKYQPGLQRDLLAVQRDHQVNALQNVMGQGATLQEALGVGGGGGAGGSGPTLGNAQQQRAADLQTAQLAGLRQQAVEREKDRALERERIQAQKDIATQRVDLDRVLGVPRTEAATRTSLAAERDSFTNQLREQWQHMFAASEEGRKRQQWDEGLWKRNSLIFFKALNMNPQNILATGVYTRGVADAHDVLNLAHWSDPRKRRRLDALIDEMIALGGNTAREALALRRLIKDFTRPYTQDDYEHVLGRPGRE